MQPNFNLNIFQLEPELWLKVPRPVDSAVIEIKYQNDEAGEDDPDDDNEVKESLENRSVLLPALAFAGSAMNLEFFCDFLRE